MAIREVRPCNGAGAPFTHDRTHCPINASARGIVLYFECPNHTQCRSNLHALPAVLVSHWHSSHVDMVQVPGSSMEIIDPLKLKLEAGTHPSPQGPAAAQCYTPSSGFATQHTTAPLQPLLLRTPLAGFPLALRCSCRCSQLQLSNQQVAMAQ